MRQVGDLETFLKPSLDFRLEYKPLETKCDEGFGIGWHLSEEESRRAQIEVNYRNGKIAKASVAFLTAAFETAERGIRELQALANIERMLISYQPSLRINSEGRTYLNIDGHDLAFLEKAMPLINAYFF